MLPQTEVHRQQILEVWIVWNKSLTSEYPVDAAHLLLDVFEYFRMLLECFRMLPEKFCMLLEKFCMLLEYFRMLLEKFCMLLEYFRMLLEKFCVLLLRVFYRFQFRLEGGYYRISNTLFIRRQSGASRRIRIIVPRCL